MSQGDFEIEVQGELPREITIEEPEIEGQQAPQAPGADRARIIQIVQELLKIMPAEMIIAYLLSLPQIISQEQKGV